MAEWSGDDRGGIACPGHVAVIGGGRWARVVVETLCALVTEAVKISVHSPHNEAAMRLWAHDRGLLMRLEVSDQPPVFKVGSAAAAIVVNAARDHEVAAAQCLASGVSVLVEKPFAMTANGAQRLIDLAIARQSHLAQASVFLFARYFDGFLKLAKRSGAIRSARILWTDPQHETRYGEHKQFDQGLPVYADWLPHVLAMLGWLAPGLTQECRGLAIQKGGAHVDLELSLGSIPCSVQLVRNAGQRRRYLEVITDQETLALDFTTEPVVITAAGGVVSAGPEADAKMRPLASMLEAFLAGAASGVFDARFDVKIGLQACRVIDQAQSLYNAAVLKWIAASLQPRQDLDTDLRYAVSEAVKRFPTADLA